MKPAFLLLLALAWPLAASADEDEFELKPGQTIRLPKAGGTDKHGCSPATGATWCSRAAQCVRPWVLAKEQGFALSPESFDKYCNSPAPAPAPNPASPPASVNPANPPSPARAASAPPPA